MPHSTLMVACSCLALAAAAEAQTCGSQWVNGGIWAINGTAYCSTLWDRDGPGPLPPALVVGGSFTIAGGTAVSNLALWDGVDWSNIGGGVSGTDHGVTAVLALAVMPNNDLVVGGRFERAGPATPAQCLARFNGSSWAPFGQGVPQLTGSVIALTVRSNGDLVALGGPFLNFDNSQFFSPARWNDTIPLWRDLPAPGPPNMGGSRCILALANGDVALGGVSNGTPGTSALFRWNEAAAQWFPYGSGITGQVLSLYQQSNSDLLVGGIFTAAGGTPANNIARWDGVQFLPYGSGITSPGDPLGPSVRALATMPNGDVIAGGNFNTAGGNVGGRIARWNGSTWARLPQGAGDFVYSLCRHPSGDLFITGAFTFAGGSFTNSRVGRYTDRFVPWVARHPSSQTLNAGDTLVLSATPSIGVTGGSFRWQRDAVTLTDGPGGASPGGGSVSGAQGALPSPTTAAQITLSISAAQASDSGIYTVVCFNACGEDTSLPAVVTVIAQPPSCDPDLNQDGNVDQDDIAYLINVISGGPNPTGIDPDFNRDGNADQDDVSALIDVIAGGPCP